MNVKEQLAAKVSRAQELTKAAQQRDLTGDEIVEVKSLTNEITDLQSQVNAADENERLIRLVAAHGQTLPSDFGVGWGKEGTGFLRLKSNARNIGRRLVDNGRIEQKSLLAGGSSSTSIDIDPAIIEQGKPARSIFDVLTTHRRTVPTYRYLRQTTRTNAAAVVAVGATKPTSTYTLTSVDASLQVIAHISEAIDTYTLGDNEGLANFVTSELLYGLALAVEAKVIADTLATSGIQTQAFVDDIFATTRKAVTDVEALGVAPDFWLMHPTDWEAMELFKDAQDRYLINSNGPVDVAARRLWSAPVVTTGAVTAGTALLMGKGAVELSTDGQASVAWAPLNDDFAKNQIRARCEGRFKTDVIRPFGVVNVDLAA